jgi:hypothetical protein
MCAESSPIPSLEHLREACIAQGVHAEDEDLEGALGFLTRILPALREIEERLPAERPSEPIGRGVRRQKVGL